MSNYKSMLVDYIGIHRNTKPESEPEPEPGPEKPKNNKYAELWEVLSHFSYPVRINHFPFKHRR